MTLSISLFSLSVIFRLRFSFFHLNQFRAAIGAPFLASIVQQTKIKNIYFSCSGNSENRAANIEFGSRSFLCNSDISSFYFFSLPLKLVRCTSTELHSTSFDRCKKEKKKKNKAQTANIETRTRNGIQQYIFFFSFYFIFSFLLEIYLKLDEQQQINDLFTREQQQ